MNWQDQVAELTADFAGVPKPVRKPTVRELETLVYAGNLISYGACSAGMSLLASVLPGLFGLTKEEYRDLPVSVLRPMIDRLNEEMQP